MDRYACVHRHACAQACMCRHAHVAIDLQDASQGTDSPCWSAYASFCDHMDGWCTDERGLVCIRMHPHASACTHASACMHMHLHPSFHMCTCIHMHAHVHMHPHACTCMRMHTCIAGWTRFMGPDGAHLRSDLLTYLLTYLPTYLGWTRFVGPDGARLCSEGPAGV